MSMIVGNELIDFSMRFISYLNLDQINGVSVDVRLGNQFEIEQRPAGYNRVVNYHAGESFESKRVNVPLGEQLIIPEHAFVKAATIEHFNMPFDTTGFLYMCSGPARAGINHSTATILQPGWSGNLVLELVNSLYFHENILIPGTKIGQIVFFHHAPVIGYSGKYNNQTSIT